LFSCSFRQHISIFCIATLGFTSCQLTRHVEDDQHLLKQNRIEGVDLKLKNELTPFIRQNPNDRLLRIFPFELWTYNIGKKWADKQPNFFNKWLRDKVGTPPVLYDSAQALKSQKLITQHLKNKGYFHAKTKYEVTKENKKARVKYQVKLGPQYHLRDIHYNTSANPISSFLKRYEQKSVLKKGQPYDIDQLKKERSLISRHYRNQGFLYFNQDYVHFEVDSNVGEHQVDIYVNISEPRTQKMAQQYKVKQVFVFPAYKAYKKEGPQKYDTLQIEGYDGYQIITKNPTAYNWSVILNSILIRKGTQHELQDKYDLTLNRLSDLGIFNFVDIRFEPVQADTISSIQDSLPPDPYLYCKILLSPSKSQELSVELEGNTGDPLVSSEETAYPRLGTALNYIYRHKNLLKGAEAFSFNVNGGLESQPSISPFFNTLDVSGQAELRLPKFLFPISRDKLSDQLNPKTRISTSYNYQRRRKQLTLTSTNLSFNYDWREFETYTFENRPYKHHTVTPIKLNYLKAGNFSEEIQKLRERNIQVRRSLANQLIFGGGYNFIHDGSYTKKNNYWFYKINLDIAGNLLKSVNLLTNQTASYDTSFQFFGLNYSQFSRLKLESGRYFKLNDKTRLVTQLRGGVGVPYGNSTVLPYIKQFFTGGSYGIRAWRVRSLGPGSYNFREDIDYSRGSFIDQTGEMLIEGNVEYRYPLFRWIKGAFFLDFGNIWNLQPDTSRPGALFQPESLINEMAIGTGFGLRLDFSFFILRFDIGAKLRDPAFEGSSAWVIDRYNDARFERLNLVHYDDPERQTRGYSLLNLNIAVGYPF
jgi:outer membrane protein assembly factor BamA